MIAIDSRLLEKALDNLLDNAFKYSPPGSAVKLIARVAHDGYSIQVSDNGPGIDKKYLQLVFDRFYRVPEENLHSVKGLGLGLPAARAAVEAIGASLTLQSLPGKGCIFTIALKIS